MKRVCRSLRHAKLLAKLLILVAATASGRSQSDTDGGATALRYGNYKAAEAFYRKALAQSPQSPEILSNLGLSLQMQGKSNAAIHAFELALRQRQMPHTYALLAEEKCKTRDLDGARTMLAQITREDSNDPSILAVVAPCYLELNEPIESVRVYENLLSYSPYPTDLALVQLAKSYLRTAQFFFGLLSRSPNNATYIDAIRKARDSGSPDARGAFEAAAKSSPYFQPDLDFSGAVARWREHPKDAALLYLLNVLSGEQSMRQIEICEEKYPDSPYLAQLRAEMLADRGYEEEAAAQYKSLMQSHPELPDLLFDLGMLYRKEREWDQALAVFQKQLAKDPDDERTAARVSEALIQLGRWKELSEFLSPKVNLTNPPLWAVLDFAEASRELDNPEQAIKALLAAEGSYPSEKKIHYQLMQLYREMGNSAQSEQELKLFQSLSTN
jgi:tetratricopeptide (TPR) repeat protein